MKNQCSNAQPRLAIYNKYPPTPLMLMALLASKARQRKYLKVSHYQTSRLGVPPRLLNKRKGCLLYEWAFPPFKYNNPIRTIRLVSKGKPTLPCKVLTSRIVQTGHAKACLPPYHVKAMQRLGSALPCLPDRARRIKNKAYALFRFAVNRSCSALIGHPPLTPPSREGASASLRSASPRSLRSLGSLRYIVIESNRDKRYIAILERIKEYRNRPAEIILFKIINLFYRGSPILASLRFSNPRISNYQKEVLTYG